MQTLKEEFQLFLSIFTLPIAFCLYFVSVYQELLNQGHAGASFR